MTKTDWKDKDKLAAAIADSSTMKEILAKLGLRPAGGNYKQLKAWAATHNLSIPVFDYVESVKQAQAKNRIPHELIFCVNSTYSNRSHIKDKMRALGIEFKCAECGIGEIYNSKKLTLQLEHKNGVYNDHRMENLALLCPNCHSQTSTFAGRQKKYKGELNSV